jgi:PTS system ascorbate-specific IIA component
MNGIFIIAHAPLAHALRECAVHVFPDCASRVAVLDVPPQSPPEESLAAARILMAALGTVDTLVLTDIFGATPCNVAQRLVDGVHSKLISGVNLPMLLRAITYRHEPLSTLVSRALAGGTQGVMQVALAAPQNQARRLYDHHHNDHQQ